MPAGMLIRWLMTQRGLSTSSSKAADEEAGQPLLSASWEHPQNNKPPHRTDSDISTTSSSEGPVIRQSTVLELTRLSMPDTHVLLVAFVFGSAAALMSACVPYFTGLIIDYASIDPDRCALIQAATKLAPLSASGLWWHMKCACNTPKHAFAQRTVSPTIKVCAVQRSTMNYCRPQRHVFRSLLTSVLCWLYVFVHLQACVQRHYAQVGGCCRAVWRIYGPSWRPVQPGHVALECAHQAGAVQVSAGTGSGLLRLCADRYVVLCWAWLLTCVAVVM